MAFHVVHCPVCGKVMGANELAFDFGELINIALEKMKNRHFGSSEEWFDLTKLRLCLYLTLENLVKDYGFKQSSDNSYRGKFVFTTDNLGKQLVKIANERDCGRMEWVCLNWNQPSIDFYLSLNAKPLDEWTTYRLDKEGLKALAEK